MSACRLLLAALAACCAASLSAQSGRVFTYVGDKPIVTHSSYRAETCDLAMRISNPLLAGKQVSHIRVLTAPDAQPSEDYKVWLSVDLNLEKNAEGKKVNAPDVLTLPAVPDKDGWIDVELPEPYTLTDKGVYVGYSFTITSYSDDGGRPIPYSQDRHADGFWFHGTKSAIKWMDYEDRMKGVLPIYVTLTGDYPSNSLAVSSWATDYPRAQAGSEYTLPLSVMNLGTEPVSEVSYTYSTGQGQRTGSATLSAPLKPDVVNPQLLFLSFAPLDELGNYTLELDLDGVNGAENKSGFRKASLPVEVHTLVPVQRVLLEEATGTWCSACPRGAVAIEALGRQYGSRFIGVAYHGGDDPMRTDAVMPKHFTSFPSATLNRGDIIDPYYGTDHTQTQKFAIQPLVEAALSLPASAAVDVTSEWADQSRQTLRAKATVAFTEDKAPEGYKVLFLLTADGLKGEGGLWMQSNSLSGADPSRLDDVLAPWADKPHKVRDIEYDHVVLLADSPEEGQALPATMAVAQTVSVTRDFALEKAVSANPACQGESLVQDKDKLAVVALLVAPDGTVVNVAKAPAGGSSASALDSLPAENSSPIVAVEYWSLDGRRLGAAPASGLCIRLSRHADGTRTAAKHLTR